MKPGYDYGDEFEYGLDPGRHRKGQGGRLTTVIRLIADLADAARGTA